MSFNPFRVVRSKTKSVQQFVVIVIVLVHISSKNSEGQAKKSSSTEDVLVLYMPTVYYNNANVHVRSYLLELQFP